ncbi:hypothetical protein DFP72DRAFT_844364 [Ephemerocybe angulata]|uniref:Uncharacterized protein n=1 Tax=Ephemerocybe angulata TaxID=980116 RepID=A0A8H6I534_9AGAR|nr:hypothetical protein DFP72DRAFT_844364 [Tulosesus angulatus]
MAVSVMATCGSGKVGGDEVAAALSATADCSQLVQGDGVMESHRSSTRRRQWRSTLIWWRKPTSLFNTTTVTVHDALRGDGLVLVEACAIGRSTWTTADADGWDMGWEDRGEMGRQEVARWWWVSTTRASSSDSLRRPEARLVTSAAL